MNKRVKLYTYDELRGAAKNRAHLNFIELKYNHNSFKNAQEQIQEQNPEFFSDGTLYTGQK